MNALADQLLQSSLTNRIGWTLLHSLWLFAVFAIVLLFVQRTWRSASSQSRYMATGICMLAMMVAIPITFISISGFTSGDVLITETERPTMSRDLASTDLGDVVSADNSAEEAASAVLAADAQTATEWKIPGEATQSSAASTSDPRHKVASPMPAFVSVSHRLSEFAHAGIAPWLSLIVAVWLIGMSLLALRPLIAWRAVRRVRRRGLSDVPVAVSELIADTAARLKLTRLIPVMESSLVDVPAVIGWLRPLVLLPTSAITGLTRDELRAVIAHELAHVRRHDYLINILQTWAETVFFYHPAIWWISHQMRIQREECCDDIAIGVTNDRPCYIRALLALDERRPAVATWAVSADGGSLLQRVQRIVFRAEPVSTGSLAPLLFFSLLLIAVFVPMMGAGNVAGSQASRQSESEDDVGTSPTVSTPPVTTEPLIDPDVTVASAHKVVRGGNADDAAERSGDSTEALCREALQIVRRRLLSADLHTPWQIMQSLHGVGPDFQLLVNGEPTSGLQWISAGQTYQGEDWFQKTEYGGRAHPYTRPYAFEGFPNQFLATLAMAGVDKQHEFQTDEGKITVEQMVHHAQMTYDENVNNSWTLIALSHYLPPTEVWRNTAGRQWDLKRLVMHVENRFGAEPLGGTAKMLAIVRAHDAWIRSGGGSDSVWNNAHTRVREFLEKAWDQQRPDGSLNANFFLRSQAGASTGHEMNAGYVLEFVVNAASDEQLAEPWIRRAVSSAARLIISRRKASEKTEPLYHTAAALRLYLNRVGAAQDADDSIGDSSGPGNGKVGHDNVKQTPKRIPSTARSLEDDWFWFDPYPGPGHSDLAGPGWGFVRLAADREVQTEIGLTEIQRAAANALYKESSARSPGRPQERVTHWNHARETLEPFLSAQQIERLDQIALQRVTYRAFSIPRVVTALDLSDTQQEQIRQAIIRHNERLAENRNLPLEKRTPMGQESHKQVWLDVREIFTKKQIDGFNHLRGRRPGDGSPVSEAEVDPPESDPSPRFFEPVNEALRPLASNADAKTDPYDNWYRPDPYPSLGNSDDEGDGRRFLSLAAHAPAREYIGITEPQFRAVREIFIVSARTEKDVSTDRTEFWNAARALAEQFMNVKQISRVEQLCLQKLQHRAFDRLDVREALELNDEQKKRIDEAVKQHFDRAIENRKTLSQSDRVRANVESGKMLWQEIRKILTPTQADTFNRMRGERPSSQEQLSLVDEAEKVDGFVVRKRRGQTRNEEVVEVSVGQDDGILVNSVLVVYRNDHFVGQLRVIETHPDSAIGVVDESTRNGQIETGDNVTNRL